MTIFISLWKSSESMTVTQYWFKREKFQRWFEQVESEIKMVSVKLWAIMWFNRFRQLSNWSEWKWCESILTILILNIDSIEFWKGASRTKECIWCTKDVWFRPIRLIDSTARRARTTTKFNDKRRGLYIVFTIQWITLRRHWTKLLVWRVKKNSSAISNFMHRTNCFSVDTFLEYIRQLSWQPHTYISWWRMLLFSNDDVKEKEKHESTYSLSSHVHNLSPLRFQGKS